MPRYSITRAGVALVLSAMSASAQNATSAAFRIAPGTTVLAGSPMTIELIGAPSRSIVRIEAERLVFSSFHSGRRLLFRSAAEFTSSDDGTVDLSAAAPSGGTYTDADLRGLFWSMAATSDSVPVGAQPNVVRLRARVGAHVVADTAIVFLNALPQVRVE